MTLKKKTTKPAAPQGVHITDCTFHSTGPTPEAVAAARLIAEGCVAIAIALRHAAETINMRAPGLSING